jgi:glycosyltransferase involved in cell wall biosynthesis
MVKPKLTIVIPCYNERETILEIIARAKAARPADKAIIVVDNCSTDGTREILVEACKNKDTTNGYSPTMPGQRILDGDGFSVVLQPKNFMKGTSVKTGIALAHSEYVVCQDADLEYDPNDITRLLELAESSGAVAVFGSRLQGDTSNQTGAFFMGRVALTKLFQVLYETEVTDVATCYKLMRTDVAKSLDMRAAGFDLDFEIPAKLRRRGYEIAELPISYTPRSHTQGKKIGWKDGVTAVWTLLKWRVMSS